ncbi:MAG: hypothetical protein ABIQ52_09675 [Vicinamibacterales bacterium]
MADYRNRRATSIDNGILRVTVLNEGGHVAEIADVTTGTNPLWTPRWPSIEPSAFDPSLHGAIYGDGADAPLLAGIMGHNLCLDIFGGPSDEEYRAGVPVHGEVSTAAFAIEASGASLAMRTELREARLRFERRIDLAERVVRIRETVENLAATDRPVAWTQHVTLGPPFLHKGQTGLRVSAERSRVFESRFGPADYLVEGADFEWPWAPRAGGGVADLRTFTDAASSSGYTAHQMNPAREHAFAVAFSPASRMAFGYVWRREDFPWMGLWEENHARTAAPWNAATLTRGLEFGVSPFPETRRQMIDRGTTFGTPGYRWIPARATVAVEYCAVLKPAIEIPDELLWPV